jgi:hypothetical protein
MSINCHGTAMTPTAIHKVAMGVAVTASGSKSVPSTGSLAVEDQRDESPSVRDGKGQRRETYRVNHAAVPVAGYLPPKAGPVAIVRPINRDKKRDSTIVSSGSDNDSFSNSRGNDAGLEVLRSLGPCRRTNNPVAFEGVRKPGGSR